MKRFLRRLRGVLGTALTWAVGWSAFTVGLSLLFGAPLEYLGLLAISGAVRGSIAGGAFAVILSIAERHHTLEDLSLRRVALWGGIGGSVLLLTTLPIIALMGAPITGVIGGLVRSAFIGAGFASGSVALAKRADRNLISGGDDPLLRIEGE